jgi:ATP-dependent Clp protease ATP-binding subunit ClpC
MLIHPKKKIPKVSFFCIEEIEAFEKRRLHKEWWFKKSQFKNHEKIIDELGAKDLTLAAYQEKLPPRLGFHTYVKTLLPILCKRECNSVLIHGENGVGCSSLPTWLSHKIVNGKIPPQLRNCRIISLNPWNLYAVDGGRWAISQPLRRYEVFLNSNPHVITVIDDFMMQMLTDPEFFFFLKYQLKHNRHRFIIVSDPESAIFMIENPVYKNLLFPIEITSATKKQVKWLFRGLLHKQLAVYHKIQIEQDLVEEAYELSEESMVFNCAQPDRTIQLLDTALAKEKIRFARKKIKPSRAKLQYGTLLETARCFGKESFLFSKE